MAQKQNAESVNSFGIMEFSDEIVDVSKRSKSSISKVRRKRDRGGTSASESNEDESSKRIQLLPDIDTKPEDRKFLHEKTIHDVPVKLQKNNLQNRTKEIEKTGVIYISRIPKYMQPYKLREILSQFGDINRTHFVPELRKKYLERKAHGGNDQRNFVEGWVEFNNKKNAKVAVNALNGSPLKWLAGKRGNPYYDAFLNLKYLKKFKWADLTEQLELEEQERQERLKEEISQATRENKIFIEGVSIKQHKDRENNARNAEHAEQVASGFRKPWKNPDFPQRQVGSSKKSGDLNAVLSRLM